MRKGKRRLSGESNKLKYVLYISVVTLAVMVISFIATTLVYNKNLKNYSSSGLTTDQISSLVPNLDTESASSEIGKNINEALNELKQENVAEETNANAVVETKELEDLTEANSKVQEEEPIPDPTFIKPVEGEIVKEFARDSLVYSETLDEWITHFGVDIKAERTTVVKAAAPGTVTAIKNDPRYGLTVIIEHVNGFKTVYSNLLTTEFVSEGEKVTEGQSIGTIGNSAVFEISDEPHLHFEILKDGEYLDPKLYI